MGLSGGGHGHRRQLVGLGVAAAKGDEDEDEEEQRQLNRFIINTTTHASGSRQAHAGKQQPQALPEEAGGRQLTYRPMRPTDLPQVRRLHEECFPIRYDDNFFEAMVAPSRSFMSLVAAEEESGEVVGAITASMEIENQNEDCDMLRFEWSWDSRYLIYLLTVGVTARYRRHGIARVLLDNLLRKAAKYDRCKAIYLHVLATNTPAISFYERSGFVRLRELPRYYHFDGVRHDALLYVFYQHGGRPPRSWDEVKDDLLRPLRRRAPPFLASLLSSSSSSYHSSPSSSSSSSSSSFITPVLRRVDLGGRLLLRSPVAIACLLVVTLPLLFLFLYFYLTLRHPR